MKDGTKLGLHLYRITEGQYERWSMMKILNRTNLEKDHEVVKAKIIIIFEIWFWGYLVGNWKYPHPSLKLWLMDELVKKIILKPLTLWVMTLKVGNLEDYILLITRDISESLYTLEAYHQMFMTTTKFEYFV